MDANDNINTEDPVAARFNGQYELRKYILGVLARIGVKSTDNKIAILARLIYVFVYRPMATFDEVVSEFAEAHGANKSSVFAIIDSCFNVYDMKFIKRVTDLTESSPFTARDVLYDLATYIRKQYFVGELHHE